MDFLCAHCKQSKMSIKGTILMIRNTSLKIEWNDNPVTLDCFMIINI